VVHTVLTQTGLGTEQQLVTSVKQEQLPASVTVLLNAEQQLVWLILSKCGQESSDPVKSITSLEPSVFWNNAVETLRSHEILSMIYISHFFLWGGLSVGRNMKAAHFIYEAEVLCMCPEIQKYGSRSVNNIQTIQLWGVFRK
jgi:hypothetical protein